MTSEVAVMHGPSLSGVFFPDFFVGARVVDLSEGLGRVQLQSDPVKSSLILHCGLTVRESSQGVFSCGAVRKNDSLEVQRWSVVLHSSL